MSGRCLLGEACPVWQGRKMLTSEFRSGVDPHRPLPAEGPVTRRPWLTPAYQGWGVERVLRTGDRTGTGLSAPACPPSLIHTSSEAPQPTYPPRPPARHTSPAACLSLRSVLPWTIRVPHMEGPGGCPAQLSLYRFGN